MNIFNFIRDNTGPFAELIFTLPFAALETLVYWIIRRIVHNKRLGVKSKAIRKKAALNETIRLLLVFWLITLANMTLTTFCFGLHFFEFLATGKSVFLKSTFIFRIGSMNLIPRIKDFSDLRHLAMNAALFVPLGAALPFILKKPGFWKTALVGFSLSLFIEIVQIFVSRESDINDVIANTLGAAFGYFVYFLIKKIFPRFSEKCSVSVNGFIKNPI